MVIANFLYIFEGFNVLFSFLVKNIILFDTYSLSLTYRHVKIFFDWSLTFMSIVESLRRRIQMRNSK